jgi:hypothetical protein
MKKRVSDIDLAPSNLTKNEILTLIQAGRSMRIQCSICEQGLINCVTFGPLTDELWCYECDTVFPNLDSIQNPSRYPDAEFFSLTEKAKSKGASEEKMELGEGFLKTYFKE